MRAAIFLELGLYAACERASAILCRFSAFLWESLSSLSSYLSCLGQGYMPAGRVEVNASVSAKLLLHLGCRVGFMSIVIVEAKLFVPHGT